jgi:hypothetical protein
MDQDFIIFLSYARSDATFAQQVAQDLKDRGAVVWIDEKMIDVGDSISESIEKGIAKAHFFCLVLSPSSVQRPWVMREYRTALTLQLDSQNGFPQIIPLLAEPVEIPILLRDTKYADFTSGYTKAFEEIFSAMGLPTKKAPLLQLLDILDTMGEDVAVDLNKAALFSPKGK